MILGPLAYLGWWGAAHSDALAPIHAQANWQREAGLPTTTLWNAAKLAFGVGVPDPNYWLIDFLVVGVAIVAVIAGARRLPLPYLVYALASLLIPLSYPFPPRPLLSMPRFVAVVFPVSWVLADATERRPSPAHRRRRDVRGRLRPARDPVHELVVHLLNRASGPFRMVRTASRARTEDGA